MRRAITFVICVVPVVVGTSVLVLAVEADKTPYIAGTAPDQRPKGAPMVREFKKPAGWYEHAVKGIVPPYPYSLRFLEDQGAWYTPFNHPGMTERYDIRGLAGGDQ